jgi:hypothetical protein
MTAGYFTDFVIILSLANDHVFPLEYIVPTIIIHLSTSHKTFEEDVGTMEQQLHFYAKQGMPKVYNFQVI